MQLLAGTSQRQFSSCSLSAQLKFESPSELTYGKLALPFGLTHEVYIQRRPCHCPLNALRAVSYSESKTR